LPVDPVFAVKNFADHRKSASASRHHSNAALVAQGSGPACRTSGRGSPKLKKEGIVSDGREEREELRKRREQEKREDREDRVDRGDVDDSEPERVDS
jgi:hypothetical protein